MTLYKQNLKSNTLEDKTYLWILGVLLVFGAFLRAWGIQYGLPYAYHPDEPLNINLVLAMGYKMDLNPHWFIHPALYFYVLGFLYGCYFAVGMVTGLWHSTENFAIHVLRDPSMLYWIARSFSVLLSSFSILLIYAVGKRFLDRRAALIAAALYTPLFLPVYFGHFAKTETLQVFLTLWALYFVSKVWHEGNIKDYMMAGCFIGFATAGKQPAVLMTSALVLAHIFRPGGCLNRDAFQKLLIAFSFIFIGFTVCSPFSVLEFSVMLKNFRQINFYTVGSPRAGQDLLLYWFRDLFQQIGIVPLIFFGISIIYLIMARSAKLWIVAIFPLVHFILFSLPSWKNVHWQVVTLPFFCLLTGDALHQIAKKGFQQKRYFQNGFILVLLIPFYANALSRVISYDLSLTRLDTRTIAKDWIEKNIPEGSKIAIEKGRFTARNAPPLKESVESIEANYLDPKSFLRQEGYQVQYLDSYYKMLIRATEGVTYDLVPLLYDPFLGQADYWKRPQIQTLEDYQRMGVQYIVVTREAKIQTQYLDTSAKEYAQSYQDFYHELDDSAKVTLIYKVTPQGNLGPQIQVYKIREKYV